MHTVVGIGIAAGIAAVATAMIPTVALSGIAAAGITVFSFGISLLVNAGLDTIYDQIMG